MTATRRPETGDRTAFLDRLRQHAASGAARTAAVQSAHPPPPPDPAAPAIGFRLVEPADDGTPADLVQVFRQVALDQHAVVDLVAAATVPVDVLAGLVRAHRIERAVVTEEEGVRPVADELAALGVDVSTDRRPTTAARADLGVTSAVAAIAATGSVVVDCEVAGSRTTSLLPRVHLCVLDAGSIVATPGQVLRPLGDGRSLPSNLVLISGPSRTGDIEQLITLGVHGPVAVHVVVTSVPQGANRTSDAS